MLTVDDANTIYKKYEGNNFFYKVSSISDKPLDFIETVPMINPSTCELFYQLNVFNCFWSGGYYVKSKTDDTYSSIDLSNGDELSLVPDESLFDGYDVYLHMCVDDDLTQSVVNLTWHPLSSLSMSVYNDESYVPKKIYLDFHGATVPETVLAGACEKGGTLSSTNVLHDTNGYYIEAVISDFTKPFFGISYDDFTYYGNIKLVAKLPQLVCNSLYRGTPQEIQVINNDTEERIMDFQAYYQGRLLQDNIINLTYDVTGYVDITVDLLDPNYVNSTVKLKAPTEFYVASTQAELETAISNGIQTIQVIDDDDTVTLNRVTLEDVTLIDSDISISNSILTNVIIHNSEYEDAGNNILTDAILDETNITSDTTDYSTYEDCIVNECTVTSTELHITGTIDDTTLTNSLIISDGLIRITGNTFTGKNTKTYFPSHLYLTGEYYVKNNSFTLNDTWTTLSYNMCVIKTIDTFKVNEFIRDNTLNLNITYSTEPTDTLYYNIVDEDKIRAVRLQ